MLDLESATPWVVLAIVFISLFGGVLIAWSWRSKRSPKQKQQAGNEYDRVVGESDSRLTEQRELRQRPQATVVFAELPAPVRAGYTAKWELLQARFVAAPQDAVNEADDLVTGLISELGYPSGDYYYEQLPGEHLRTLQSYREAHQISLSNRRGEASAEQLRQAVAHFRALVTGLLGEQQSLPVPEAAIPRGA